MPIVRVQDPLGKDRGHQIKTVLGKMCDIALSSETKINCVERLSALMEKLPATAASFEKFGIEAKMVIDPKDKTKVLMVHVPKEYIGSNIKENRDDQWISFGIANTLDTSNLGHDTIEVKELKK